MDFTIFWIEFELTDMPLLPQVEVAGLGLFALSQSPTGAQLMKWDALDSLLHVFQEVSLGPGSINPNPQAHPQIDGRKEARRLGT